MNKNLLHKKINKIKFKNSKKEMGIEEIQSSNSTSGYLSEKKWKKKTIQKDICIPMHIEELFYFYFLKLGYSCFTMLC